MSKIQSLPLVESLVDEDLIVVETGDGTKKMEIGGFWEKALDATDSEPVPEVSFVVQDDAGDPALMPYKDVKDAFVRYAKYGSLGGGLDLSTFENEKTALADTDKILLDSDGQASYITYGNLMKLIDAAVEAKLGDYLKVKKG